MSFMNPFFPVDGDPEEIPDDNAQMAAEETQIAQADIDQDRDTIIQRVFDRIAERVPGWTAHDGNLDTWLVEEWSTVAAEIRQEALSVPEAIFRVYGEEVLGILSRPPAPATGVSTWTAVDAQGYSIPVGTQITIPRTGDDLVAFETVGTTVIDPGTTSVTGVSIRAIDDGAFANGLSGPADVVDPLTWVQSITVDAPTTEGDDGQTLEDYLSQLVVLMRLVALRPILPWDFAVLALRVPGIARAVAMDTYDANLQTWGNARTITLIVTDANGQPVPQAVKDQAREMLEDLREVNWVVYVIDANYEPINVTYQAQAFAEQDPAFVQSLVDEALTDYLSPANFRLGTTTPGIQAGEVIPPPAAGQDPVRQTIRMNDLVARIDRVRGVDFIPPGGVQIQGTAGDYTLSSPITLPTPGTITGTVTLPAPGTVSSP